MEQGKLYKLQKSQLTGLNIFYDEKTSPCDISQILNTLYNFNKMGRHC